MRLPGRAWLEFVVTPKKDGCEITQTAIFDPVGLFGLCYWYSIWPLHQFIFTGMLRNLVQAAKELEHQMDSEIPQTQNGTT
jgi:hypothetical protein